MTVYDGPAIDSHHHFWDLSMGRHPWLAAEGGLTTLGDLAYLRHDYLPRHFAADCDGTGVVATVCIEALWDATSGPLEEIAWLDSLERPAGIAGRYVARLPLGDPGVEAELAQLAAHPRMAGVRQTIRWHPDPARSWADPAPTDDPAWRQGVGRLHGHGLLLELLIYPWQADAVLGIAREHPALTIVVNHCSSPIDRDEAGLERWLRGLRTMAAAPNVHLKLSNFAKYAASPGVEAARAVVQPCIDAFGSERCLWGSDYPVARSTMPYGSALQLFRAAIADRTITEQRSILFDNTARLYGLP